jgi:2-polyprenyl-6-hydroxyphenyl methylase/3-demethylubiquinone-9 3-methyltransferase
MMDKETPRPLDGATDARTDARTGTTVDAAEIAKFTAMAEEWWDPAGKFRPLHQLNPARLGFIRDRIAGRSGRDPLAPSPLSGLTVLDIGCGGGLLTEPLCRLGAAMTGVDAAERNIEIARIHAEQMGLDIDYRFATAADLATEGLQYDAVVNMEVIEHVADVDVFIAETAALIKPGGLMLLSTLNRTAKSFALAIVGAEYILRWLPRGTHDWRRFVRPSELAASCRHAGLAVTELAGLRYDPFKDRWQIAPGDLDVNYMAVAEKPA